MSEISPMPYEIEFGMSNASDCADWLRAHPDYLLEYVLAWDKSSGLRHGVPGAPGGRSWGSSPMPRSPGCFSTVRWK